MPFCCPLGIGLGVDAVNSLEFRVFRTVPHYKIWTETEERQPCLATNDFSGTFEQKITDLWTGTEPFIDAIDSFSAVDEKNQIGPLLNSKCKVSAVVKTQKYQFRRRRPFFDSMGVVELEGDIKD